jgi:hypothetical protein
VVGESFNFCARRVFIGSDETGRSGESIAAVQGQGTYDHADNGLSEMYIHDMLDLVTCMPGDIHIVLETDEMSLRPGRLCHRPGLLHTGSNKTDQPAVLTSLMTSASIAK